MFLFSGGREELVGCMLRFFFFIYGAFFCVLFATKALGHRRAAWMERARFICVLLNDGRVERLVCASFFLSFFVLFFADLFSGKLRVFHRVSFLLLFRFYFCYFFLFSYACLSLERPPEGVRPNLVAKSVVRAFPSRPVSRRGLEFARLATGLVGCGFIYFLFRVPSFFINILKREMAVVVVPFTAKFTTVPLFVFFHIFRTLCTIPDFFLFFFFERGR